MTTDTKQMMNRVETIRTKNEENKIKKAEKNVHLENLSKQRDENLAKLKEKGLTLDTVKGELETLESTLETKVTECEKTLNVSNELEL